jgi:hypothetical protein
VQAVKQTQHARLMLTGRALYALAAQLRRESIAVV